MLWRVSQDDVVEFSFHRDGLGRYVERRSSVISGPLNLEDFM
jgi:hypothetical protein